MQKKRRNHEKIAEITEKNTKIFRWICIFLLQFPVSMAWGGQFHSTWQNDVDRQWVGPQYWANRLQDWRVSDGRLECLQGQSQKPMRTVHLLTRRLGANIGEFAMSVRLGLTSESTIRLGLTGETAKGSLSSAAGFLIGAGGKLDYRAAALVHHSGGPGGGLFAGIDGDGCLFIRDFNQFAGKPAEQQSKSDNYLVRQVRGTGTRTETGTGVPENVELRISAKPVGQVYSLTLTSRDPETGRQLGSIALDKVDPVLLTGNVALVSSPGASSQNAGCYWFCDWKITGSKVEVHDDRLCGPILSTQYTLSRGILKMTAQMMPTGPADNQTVKLQIQQSGDWKTAATASITVPGYTATFRIAGWDSSRQMPYRVLYDLKQTDGTTKTYTWSGRIARDPVDKQTIVVAAFTGNHNVRRPGVERGRYTWTADWLWFPHNDIVKHVRRHNPDLLFFSGDQVYEGGSPTAAVKSPLQAAQLDYLYKWYLWCWAFRDLARDMPCITIPDDHDVYQGNLWGAGGRKIRKDDRGGYVMPAEWVKMVERTQTSNLPDPYDPAPIEQGIGTYYTAMNYGRIDFAILEDRKFKSGPAGLVPSTDGRADHVTDRNFDPRTADVPGATLLGARQLEFLSDWAADWRNTEMKVALSQTVFANVATHHGPGLAYLVADYDSNGWPQTGRNKALHEMRRCFAFMIGGDQHLATIVHHGIDDFDDAGWSFCVPSIANFYPRAWNPPVPGKNRLETMPEYTGRFLDGLGNHVTVWAATNPGRSTGKKPAELHDKMPGYGIVRFDKKTRKIIMECHPRYADPADPGSDEQYPGWPKTIEQLDNYGRKVAAYLPTLEITGLTDPVVQIIDEAGGEIVYTLRIKGTSFRPKVFRSGTYTIKVGRPETGKTKNLTGVQSISPQDSRTIEVKF